MSNAAIPMGALLALSVGLAGAGPGPEKPLTDAGAERATFLRAGAVESSAFTGRADLGRDAAIDEEDHRVSARVNAMPFDKGRRNPLLLPDDDSDATSLAPIALNRGADLLETSGMDFREVDLERYDFFDAGGVEEFLHRRATPINRGLARLGADALRSYVKPYVNSTPGERFRLDERFLGGAAIGGVIYYRPGMTGWRFALGVFRTPESSR